MGLIILVPFKIKDPPNGGSSIRIKGYTQYFYDRKVPFKFVSPSFPSYISPSDYVRINIKGILFRLLLIHNLLNSKTITGFLATIIRPLLLLNPDIRKILDLAGQHIVISHKDHILTEFLRICGIEKIIFDIHGILNLQKEYAGEFNAFEKYWFRLQLKHENILFRNAGFINAVNRETITFLKKNFQFSGRAFLAPDGISKKEETNSTPEISIKDINKRLPKKYILFYGSFKKFGGVHLLMDAFVQIRENIPDYALLLIGRGQMDKYLRNSVNSLNLNNRVFFVSDVPYTDLPVYQEKSSLIVVPDIENNYNHLTPHIKLFDSINSGKIIVVADFPVNREVINLAGYSENTIFFSPSSTDDLANKILLALKMKAAFPDNGHLLENLSYATQCENLISSYEEYFGKPTLYRTFENELPGKPD